MLSDNLGEKKIFVKGLEFLHVVFNVIEKRAPVFFPLVFALFTKTPLGKPSGFFCIRNISKTKRSLAEKLRDIATQRTKLTFD